MVYYPGNEVKLPGFHRTAAERVRSISRVRFCSDARNGVLLPRTWGGAAPGCLLRSGLFFGNLCGNFRCSRMAVASLPRLSQTECPGDLLTKNHKQNQASKRRCVPIGTNAKETQTLINEAIDVREVRVVDAEGQPLGIMSSREALRLAYDKDMDLVLIAPQAQPPVCKIMDYGKYCFEKQKREKEAKKKQQTVELKEIQISYRIDTHDYETKLNQARKFLSSGNKVRVVMKFRGREMSHMAMGRDILEKFLADTHEVGSCDKKPVLEGRFMSMVINPLSNKAK